MKIGFIGVGKLGKDAAEVMYESGHDVLGYDVKTMSDTKINMNANINNRPFHSVNAGVGEGYDFPGWLAG